MKISEVRIYAEVLEQSIDFKDYFLKAGVEAPIKTIYAKKGRSTFDSSDSFLTRLRKSKDVDILISFVSEKNEYPVLMVEYSTAVPTDDHKMQRSDVYFWGSVFKVPELKIYPKSKGMRQNFGGGDRFTDEQEQIVAFRKGTILWPILWDNINNTVDVLQTKQNRLSCISYSKEILGYVKKVITSFEKASSFIELHNIEMRLFKKENKKIFEKYEGDNLHNMIVNSARFTWDIPNEKLIVKINRFGHAMDPDRGALFFTNMLVGFNNLITEFQVNRRGINNRGGYKSLFDSLASKDSLLQYVNNIINNQGNVFTDEDAIYVFRKALSIADADIPFKKIGEHKYHIDDLNLFKFLNNHPSVATKSLFLLSSELRFTDKNRRTICSITWDETPIRLFLGTIATNNFAPLPLKQLSQSDVKEDIITYASVELYKKLQFGLLAVSYPGAQGDRAILTGQGRRTKRTYVDIIAYSVNKNEYIVYLEECKDKLSKSGKDIVKLNGIINSEEKMSGLKELFRKTIRKNNIKKVYKSVGGSFTNSYNSLNVDYIFMFNISERKRTNNLIYTVAVVDLNLIDTFKPLANKHNRLEGIIKLEDVFIIDQ